MATSISAIFPRPLCGLLALCCCAPLVQALEIGGRLSSDQSIGPADSPVSIQDSLVVPEGVTLTIQAGTTILLGPKAEIRVRGDLLALGEKRRPIQFDWAEQGQHWGNINIWGQKDLPSYDGDYLFIEGSGSRLNWCEIRHGGAVADVAYNGGAIYLNGAAPCITNCTFQENESERCGGILAYNFSLPLISDCTFENNRASLDDGGAIYCFFYSDAVVRHNFIVQNSAGRHGGGIYISNSSPLVEANAFIDNSAGIFGGALFVSGSESRIIDNAIFQNQGSEKSTGIVFRADCRPELSGNSLLSGGVEVLGINLSYDLDLRKNWWGTINELELATRTRQNNTRGREVKFTIAPWLDRPAENLLTQPVEIERLDVMASSAWRDTLRFDLVAGATVRVQVRAVDRNKYAIDQTPVSVSLLERPEENFRLILSETAKNSGIFRGEFVLSDSTSNVSKSRLNTRIGEHVLLRSTMDEEKRAHYAVDEPRPVVYDLAILSDPDPEHIVTHKLRVAWKYFDLLERPQQAWQIQVDSRSSFQPGMEWDPGEVTAAADLRETFYAGSALLDGERYGFRIRLRAGANWSAWRDFTVRSDNEAYSFRLNSIPPTPGLQGPADDVILPVTRPEFVVEKVSDREGDTVSYQFQISENEVFSPVIAEQIEGELLEPRWTAPLDLRDNGHYYWRIRVWDGFEFSNWSQPRGFWLNPVEELPAVFTLQGPSGELADVNPLYHWAASSDPDPKATLHYRFLIADNGAMQNARTVDSLKELEFRDTKELPNRKEIWWAVEAVDNTNRATRCGSRLRLFADTTPSDPVPLFPREEEILAEQSFRLKESTDPWSADKLLYDLELSGDGDFGQPLVRLQNLELEDIRQSALDSWPESQKLKDNQKFFWRVKAIDNHGAASSWSPVSAAWFNRRNDEPTIPAAPFSPSGGVDVAEAVVIQWGASTDPDPSDESASLTYHLQLAHSSDFSGRVTERSIKGATQIGFAMDELDDNQLWFWRVRCEDNERASKGWSTVQQFVRNRSADAPSAFAILNPVPGSSSFRLDGVTLNWRESTDPDWNASLQYYWVLATDENLNAVVKQGQIAVPPLEINLSFKNGQAYWLGLRAVDDTGLETSAQSVGFTVDSRPSKPVVQSTGADLELKPEDELRWQASVDPDPADAIKYHVRIVDAKSAKRVVDAAGVESSSPQLNRLYGSDGLKDDTFYSWTVTASDPHDLTAESDAGQFWFNRANDAPTVPVFTNGFAEGASLGAASVKFDWAELTDPDHSDTPLSLSGQVQLSNSVDFKAPRTLNGEAGAREVTIDLADDTRWFARLRALDDQGKASGWSTVSSFVINTTEDPPTAPALIQPAQNARLVKLDGLKVEFRAATDPDVDSQLSYRVELLTAAGTLLNIIEMAAGKEQLWQIALENAQSFSLRVIAVDNTGLETASSLHSFGVDTTPGPVQISGREGRIMGPGDALEWTEAIDPDTEDRLSYEIQLDRNRAFPNAATQKVRDTKLSMSQFGSVSVLSENADALVRIRAVDPHGITGDWSPPHQFVWDAVNDAPTFNGKLSPADGLQNTTEVTIGWTEPSDPDRRKQQLKVVIEIASDEKFNNILVSKTFTATLGQATVTLKENQHRWLRAFVKDQDGKRSTACAPSHYVINAKNEKPSKPRLGEPSNGSSQQQFASFKWKASVDPDPGDHISYRIEISSDSGYSGSWNTSGNSHAVTLSQPGKYQWTVVAVDDAGLESSAAKSTFTIPKPAPAPGN